MNYTRTIKIISLFAVLPLIAVMHTVKASDNKNNNSENTSTEKKQESNSNKSGDELYAMLLENARAGYGLTFEICDAETKWGKGSTEFLAWINRKIGEGETALHLAAKAKRSRLDNCNMLIKHGAEVNIKDKYGFTPLFGAASEGYINTCKFLIDHQAEVNDEVMGIAKERFIESIGFKGANDDEIVKMLLKFTRLSKRQFGVIEKLVKTKKEEIDKEAILGVYKTVKDIIAEITKINRLDKKALEEFGLEYNINPNDKTSLLVLYDRVKWKMYHIDPIIKKAKDYADILLLFFDEKEAYSPKTQKQ